MPDFEEDGSEGDSGEEDSMANFMGEEVSERDDERGHNLSGDDDEEADDYESGSEKGARQDIANENEQAGYESASEEEQENYATGSEREASEGSVIGEEEETAKKYVGVHEGDGTEFESEEAVSVPGRSFQDGRGLRTSTNFKQDFGYDSVDGIKSSNFDHGGQNNTGRLLAFSKEDSQSEQEDYDGSSERDDLEVGGAKDGAHEDLNNHQNVNEADVEKVDDKEEEIDGEIEEKDRDDEYEADENGEDYESEFKADKEIPCKTSLRKNDLKSLNFPGLRTNVRNGEFVPRLSKPIHFRQPSPDPSPESEEAGVEVEAQSEPGHEPEVEYVESEAEDDDDEEEEGNSEQLITYCCKLTSKLNTECFI